jgi:regulator of sigma E protease
LGTAWLVLQVAVALGLVIFVHELGHFLAVKACGVKCEKFYLGFDIPLRFGRLVLPSAICRFRWGETEYGIGILPLGGYVKMLGQDDNPANQKRENQRIRISKTAATAGPTDQAGTTTAPQAAPPTDAAPSGTAGAEPQATELDPRSFPAKPVWQRMIIISAGVVMNLVFAMVFAAVAYRAGVVYTPCVLGGTSPGDPAWVQGLQPGDKILQIGRDGQPDEKLRFTHDLTTKVILSGADQALELLVRRQGHTEPEWIEIRPSNRLKWLREVATLGVTSAATTRLHREHPVVEELAEESPYDQLPGGGEIVAVDGTVLPRDPQLGVILSHPLEAVFARRLAEPVTLRIARPPQRTGSADAAPQELEVTLPPRRLRVLGLAMRAGPIVGVRQGTPADAAGFRAGDVLLTWNGQDLGDPVTLAQRLLPLAGQEVAFGVRRAALDTPLVLRAKLQTPTTCEHQVMPGSLVALDSLGVAFPVENVAVSVEDGSPAAAAGLRKGDEIVQVRLLPPDQKADGKTRAKKRKGDDEAIKLDAERTNWYYVHAAVQLAKPGTRLEITYRREGQNHLATLEPVTSDRWYYPWRGILLTGLSQVRTASSWDEACRLGLREAKEKVVEVAVVLHRLVTGRISVKNLGGPIMIAVAAGSEASKGIPALLIFLCLLSANLAVLNILPIPVLDGGHLMFLAAEGIRGKPVDERLQFALTLIGFFCLIGLMILVFGLDIRRLVS